MPRSIVAKQSRTPDPTLSGLRGSLPALAVRSTLVLSALPAAWAQSMVNQHVSSAGVQADFSAANDRPCFSADERYVAFASGASNLVGDDANGRYDVFVHDNLTGATALMSRSSGGSPSNGDSRRPWLSGTGRYVAFQSDASNLVAGMAGVHGYRHDRDADGDGVFDEAGAVATVVVSLSSGGALGDGPSRCYTGSISSDGDRVAFESDATNLVAGDTNGRTDAFVRVVGTGTTLRVSVASDGSQGASNSGYPSLSGDGFFVSFWSNATNLVPGDTNGSADIFRRALATGVTARASITSAGAQATGSSFFSSISGDGARIAFESYASDLVPGDTNGTRDVFVRDMGSGTTARVSISTAGAQAASGGSDPHISGDGTAVAFVSPSPDLVAGDTNGTYDVFVHRIATGVTARASRAVNDTQANGFSAEVSLSLDGSEAAFFSYATNLLAGDANGQPDIFLRGGVFLGPISLADPMGSELEPVTLSVNGPVDPHTDGIRYARGAPATPQVPLQPGNPMGACIRAGPVPQAAGIASAMPGDVFDHDALPLPSEAHLVQSPPLALAAPGPPPMPPDGTNNQILAAVAMGLIAGGAVPTFAWHVVPPMFPGRDNVDAISFGEDYFPPGIELGLAPDPLPPPPTDPMGEILVGFAPWPLRASLYAEPVVVDHDPAVSFHFSTDPWAIGLPLTALIVESGGADAGAGCGPWISPGAAAGDVFATPLLARMGAMTLGGGANLVVHQQATLGLASLLPLDPMEDDLDGLECVGENTSPWFPGGTELRPGNLHARVMDVGLPDPPPPGLSVHDPVNDAPVFFSVTRNSPGAAFTAVRSQFVIDGGAAADVFVAVKDPADPAGIGLNLLFIDESEIGLYAMDPSPGATSPADLTDDLDALILRVCPEYRAMVSLAIDEILGLAPPFTPGGLAPWMPYGLGALTGGGMTISVTKYLDGTGRPIPPGCIQVGFSVTTDSIGLEYTAVDWESGPVFPAGGVSAAAGDVFYAEVDGSGEGPNHLWFEEIDLGLDMGTWVDGVSASLDELTDNLDALDSIDRFDRGGLTGKVRRRSIP